MGQSRFVELSCYGARVVESLCRLPAPVVVRNTRHTDERAGDDSPQHVMNDNIINHYSGQPAARGFLAVTFPNACSPEAHAKLLVGRAVLASHQSGDASLSPSGVFRPEPRRSTLNYA